MQIENPLVYLNGKFIPRDQAFVSVDDRGFVYADSLYEGIHSYHGYLFEMKAHLRRLQRGLEILRIQVNEFDRLEEIAKKLITENNLQNTDAFVYIQITRGVAFPRRHAFPPASTPPTVYLSANPLIVNLESAEKGIAVITTPDLRWGRCDLKSTNLLANVLATQEAIERGTDEAILVKDGIVTEGSRSSVFAVFDGTIQTYPLDQNILPGITRQVVLDLCQHLKFDVLEKTIPEKQFTDADEIFIAQTTGEVLPVVKVNNTIIANGLPGEITRRLQQAFSHHITALRAKSRG